MSTHTERTYQDDLNTAALSELLGVPPCVAVEFDYEDVENAINALYRNHADNVGGLDDRADDIADTAQERYDKAMREVADIRKVVAFMKELNVESVVDLEELLEEPDDE